MNRLVYRLRSPRRSAAIFAGAAALAGAAVFGVASPASAAGYPCSHDGHAIWCATVTAINPGSYLASHYGPSYSSGQTGRRYYNGQEMELTCWTTGDPDTDGHGDRYWFMLDFDGDSGYVNDWYLTTGSPSQWQAHVAHC